MEKPDFWKSTPEEQSETLYLVKKGIIKTVAKSAGNRDVYLVEYGEKQDFFRTANYSSSCGAGSAKYYADKIGKKPVIFLVGAIHGAELEGTCALLNLIKLIETGKDYHGNTNQFLSSCIDLCRLLVIPLANPDGRARCIPDSMIGLSYEEFRHFSQGRWINGSLCEWPKCKTFHPIKDHVSFLGAYYNDNGINMMHDNFFGNMASETKALLDIAGEEAPDFIALLHGGGNTKNEILDTDYVPFYIKQRIHDLSLRVKAEVTKLNMPCAATKIQFDDSVPPLSFNLTSALHHVCGAVSYVYESNQGICKKNEKWETILSHEEILIQHYILFEQTIRYALEINEKQ